MNQLRNRIPPLLLDEGEGQLQALEQGLERGGRSRLVLAQELGDDERSRLALALENGGSRLVLAQELEDGERSRLELALELGDDERSRPGLELALENGESRLELGLALENGGSQPGLALVLEKGGSPPELEPENAGSHPLPSLKLVDGVGSHRKLVLGDGERNPQALEQELVDELQLDPGHDPGLPLSGGVDLPRVEVMLEQEQGPVVAADPRNP